MLVPGVNSGLGACSLGGSRATLGAFDAASHFAKPLLLNELCSLSPTRGALI